MNRYHYIDDQGNISDALPLAALQKIGLPPATKVLLEGGKQWTTLEHVSQGGPVVLPVTPPVVPASPPPPLAPAQPTPPGTAATASSPATPADKPKTSATKGCLGCLGVIVGILVLLGIIGAIVGPSDSGNTGSSSSTASDSSNDPQASARSKYAGVYETTSGSLTFAGGLGLFASGNYTLMFGQSGTKRSGTWTVEGSTIRLKGSDSGDTVLRILNSEQLAYERNGVEVVYTIKERQ